MLTIDWNALEDFSSRLSQSGLQLGTIPDDEWKLIEKALISFSEEKDWQSIVRLRKLFNNLFASDTLGGYDLLQELDQKAIDAARQLDDKAELAHLLACVGTIIIGRGIIGMRLKLLTSLPNYIGQLERISLQ